MKRKEEAEAAIMQDRRMEGESGSSSGLLESRKQCSAPSD